MTTLHLSITAVCSSFGSFGTLSFRLSGRVDVTLSPASRSRTVKILLSINTVLFVLCTAQALPSIYFVLQRRLLSINTVHNTSTNSLVPPRINGNIALTWRITVELT